MVMPLKYIENSRYYHYVDDWKKLYEKGYSTITIAKKYNLGTNVVYSHLKLLGIVRNSKEAAKFSEDHSQWKGNDVSYNSLHRWVKVRIPKPKLCPMCEVRKAMDLANVSHVYNPETYNRDLSNWKWLCRKCHMTTDGRLEKLKHAQHRHLIYKEK